MFGIVWLFNLSIMIYLHKAMLVLYFLYFHLKLSMDNMKSYRWFNCWNFYIEKNKTIKKETLCQSSMLNSMRFWHIAKLDSKQLKLVLKKDIIQIYNKSNLEVQNGVCAENSILVFSTPTDESFVQNGFFQR